MTQNFVACRLEKNFKNAELFDPEKWLKNSDKKQMKYNPYLVLPFGHGMRSCIARRLAEQSILIFIIRVIIKHVLIIAVINCCYFSSSELIR